MRGCCDFTSFKLTRSTWVWADESKFAAFVAAPSVEGEMEGIDIIDVASLSALVSCSVTPIRAAKVTNSDTGAVNTKLNMFILNGLLLHISTSLMFCQYTVIELT